ALIAYFEIVVFKNSTPVRKRINSVAILLALFGVPTAVYLLMRYNAVNSIVALVDTRYSSWVTLKSVPIVTAKYLELIFLPMGYSIQHFTAPVTSIATSAFIGPVVLIGTVVAVLFIIRSKTLTFAAVWFIVWLAPPISSIRIFVPLYYVQERYLYLPSVGVCLAAALGTEWLANLKLFGQSFGRVATAALVGVILVFLSLVTIEQNTAWRDTIALYRHAVAADPRGPFAHTALAGAYFEEGKTREAEAEAHTALDLDPTCIDGYLVLSVFAHASGKTERAINYLLRAESKVPDGVQKRGYLAKIYSKLAFLYNERESYDLAEEYLRREVELTPYTNSWLELGDFYFDRGRYQEALEMFEQVAAHVNRRFAPIHLKLARTQDRLGLPELARNEYQQYLELAPAAALGRSEASRRLLNR
ncbi:MAG TPA: tetratricopeptide repeat protein, partial [Blastocatellia bacterium]